MTQPGPNEVLIAAVAAQTGLDAESVRAVLEAQRDPALAGPPPGTMQRDPVTGDVAVRVVENSKPMWWVITQQDGSATRDYNPTKEWPDITPTEGDT